MCREHVRGPTGHVIRAAEDVALPPDGERATARCAIALDEPELDLHLGRDANGGANAVACRPGGMVA